MVGDHKDVALSVEGVSKSFGAIQALQNVSFTIRRGEVMCLVGDNGAGKSTVVKIIAGVHQPDEGQVLLDEERTDFASPHDARAAGIETVYQDLGLVDTLDVAANFFLGRELRTKGLGRFGLLRHAPMRQRSAQGIKDLHVKIPGGVSSAVERMSGGQRQAVAIARAAFWRQRLVILDEPTAALGVEESAEVLRLIETMADEGIPVLLISHNMEHVWSAAHRICVFRQGVKTAEVLKSETTPREIVGFITGASSS